MEGHTMSNAKLMPVPGNDETSNKLAVMLGDEAIIKGVNDTYLKYAMKDGTILLVAVKLRLGYEKLHIVLRLISVGDPKAFSSVFPLREKGNGGYNRLSKVKFNAAHGDRSECLKTFAEAGVAKAFATWLDSKVVEAGAVPQDGLIEILLNFSVAQMTPKAPEVDFDKALKDSIKVEKKYHHEEDESEDGSGEDDEPDETDE